MWCGVGEWRLNAYMWVMLSIHNTRGRGSWVTLQRFPPFTSCLAFIDSWVNWVMSLFFFYAFHIHFASSILKKKALVRRRCVVCMVMCNLLWTQRILHINSKINHSLAWLCHPTLIIRWSSLTPIQQLNRNPIGIASDWLSTMLNIHEMSKGTRGWCRSLLFTHCLEIGGFYYASQKRYFRMWRLVSCMMNMVTQGKEPHDDNGENALTRVIEPGENRMLIILCCRQRESCFMDGWYGT